MAKVKMPDGEVLDVPDELFRSAHHPGATLIAVDKTVKSYHPNMTSRDGFDYSVLDIEKVEADFTGRVRKFDVERLKSVINAIGGATQLPPIDVRKTGGSPPYTVADGFHRYIATVIAGFPQIPCFVAKQAEPEAPIQPKSINPLKRPAPNETEEEAKARRKARFG